MSLEHVFENTHRRQKSSVSSLSFLARHNSTASVSDASVPYKWKLYRTPIITPHIREAYYGQTIGMRSNAQMEIGSDPSLGIPDLVHIGKYLGSKSYLYLHDDFNALRRRSGDDSNRKDDDGYVGFYHYENGIDFEGGEEAIENHICELLNLEKNGSDCYWKDDKIPEHLAGLKREFVVTLCSYNLFARSDFRARYTIYPINQAKKKLVKIEKSYQIIPNAPDMRSRKVYNFSSHTLGDVHQNFWLGLTASGLIRLFVHLDDPGKQISGLVSLFGLVDTKENLLRSIKILVKFLPYGSATDINASYGAVTAGGDSENPKRTNWYRNSIVDVLIRISQLDSTGGAARYAILEIKKKYYVNKTNGDFDYVILKLMQCQGNVENEKEFVHFIHDHLNAGNIYNTQLALILQEQVKYLVSKKKFGLALKVAKKCSTILPLDFDAWYNLALCYVLIKDYENALLTMNSMPIILNQKSKNIDIDHVSGIKDLYLSTLIERLNSNEEIISEKSFKNFFPPPQEYQLKYESSSIRGEPKSRDIVEKGSIHKMWHDMFLFNEHLRHPMIGNQFYQSPLLNCSSKELGSINPSLIKLCGPESKRMIMASRSAASVSSSILDFTKTSTWGRCYDLLTLLTAIVGWDDLVYIKENLFQDQESLAKNLENPDYIVDKDINVNRRTICENWLEQLFIIVYEDLRTLMVLSSHERDLNRSAIEWNILGLLGWSVKYNLKDTISDLITSVMGFADSGNFDYFGSVKILEIYDEFILSDINNTGISLFHDEYEHKLYSHKFILHLAENSHESFIKALENNYLTLDFILLTLMKLISWNVRWYQYVPNHLVTKILMKLCIKHDPVYIRSRVRLVFEQNKNNSAFTIKNKKAFFPFSSNTGAGNKSKRLNDYEFGEKDTILSYTESLVEWIETLKENL